MTLQVVVKSKVGMVLCRDLDFWHKETDSNPWISYIIWNNRMIDDPGHMVVLRILKHYPKRERVIIYQTCFHCRKRLGLVK